ncbi:ribonuclease H-like domain-containing protein [Phyllosticta capitalensis]
MAPRYIYTTFSIPKQNTERLVEVPYPSARMYACPECGIFLSHASGSQVVLTDGACSNNGQSNAAAGCGVAMGEKQSQQLAMPFGGMDCAATKTNQRAELLAALAGIVEGAEVQSKQQGQFPGHSHPVDRMKEWLPVWKKNGLKTSSGTTPTNLDLFSRIEWQIEKIADDKKVSVDFCHIPREQNGLADSLAKSAAEMDKKMDRFFKSWICQAY